MHNAHHRDAKLENLRSAGRSVFSVNAVGPAGEDYAYGGYFGKLLGADGTGPYLRVDAAFADAPRYQLLVLPAKIYYNNSFVRHILILNQVYFL
jgi:hypothetical protein